MVVFYLSVIASAVVLKVGVTNTIATENEEKPKSFDEIIVKGYNMC